MSCYSSAHCIILYVSAFVCIHMVSRVLYTRRLPILSTTCATCSSSSTHGVCGPQTTFEVREARNCRCVTPFACLHSDPFRYPCWIPAPCRHPGFMEHFSWLLFHSLKLLLSQSGKYLHVKIPVHTTYTMSTMYDLSTYSTWFVECN